MIIILRRTAARKRMEFAATLPCFANSAKRRNIAAARGSSAFARLECGPYGFSATILPFSSTMTVRE